MELILNTVSLIVAFVPTYFFYYYLAPILLDADDVKMASAGGLIVSGIAKTLIIVMCLWAVVFYPGGTHVIWKLVIALIVIGVMSMIFHNMMEHREKRVAAFCAKYPQAAQYMLKDSAIARSSSRCGF